VERIPSTRPEWGKLEAALEDREPIQVQLEMNPETAQVREAIHLSFSLSFERDLGCGFSVLILVPKTWKLDLNGAFPEISKFFAIREGGYGNGRQCLVHVETPVYGLETRCELIPAGYEFLIHTELRDTLPAGTPLIVHLAHPDGPRIRAPQTVQFHPFVTAARMDDEDHFRPLSTTPGVKTTGGTVRSIRVTTQAVIERGEISQVKVVPMDVFGLNRAGDYGGTVELVETSAEGPPCSVDITPEETSARVEVSLTADHPFRYIQARDLGRDLVGRSNPIGRPEAFAGYRVFFGDLHAHCRPCDGYGSMEEAYGYAYEISELDFASISHQQNSSNFPFSQKHWQAYLDINEQFNQKDAFATLPICENYSSFGHRHSLFGSLNDASRFPVGPDYWGNPYDPSNHPDRLWETLADLDALTFPHHMKFIHGTDFSIPPNPLEPVMEICSRWGISEYGGEHSAQYALSQGRRMGLIGGTDNHLGQPGSGTHGYNEGRGWTAVLTKSLDRESIYDAIRTRRCYATTGAKILMFFALGEHLMGNEVRGWKGNRNFRITVAGTAPVEKVEVVRNGDVVFLEETNSYIVEMTFCDEDPVDDIIAPAAFDELAPFCYYYLRVTQKDRNQAWSSPIWIS
jgi:hypothetical protein